MSAIGGGLFLAGNTVAAAIDQKTAKKLGIVVRPTLIARADTTIE
jgi:hypothetical protein